MSEYWKSTPKYWCKYCSTYVKDTPLEKTNHEAGPRHQGNLKRSLRDLHRDNERSEREKQHAKAEAARLNGTGPAAGQSQTNGDGRFKTTVNFTKTPAKSASVDDRKRQVAQLAALGVAVPEDFRRENAMVGDWQASAKKIVSESRPSIKKEEEFDSKPILNFGVRKRKTEEPDELAEFMKSEDGQRRPKYRRGLQSNDDDDELNALLSSTTESVRNNDNKVKKEVKEENADGEAIAHDKEPEPEPSTVHIKEEPDEGASLDTEPVAKAKSTSPEPTNDDMGSIFKKRKRPMKK